MNENGTIIERSKSTHIQKRTEQFVNTPDWHLSAISIPPDLPFNIDYGFTELLVPAHLPSTNRYSYAFDDSGGQGQTIYIIEPGWTGVDEGVRSLGGRAYHQSLTLILDLFQRKSSRTYSSKVGY